MKLSRIPFFKGVARKVKRFLDEGDMVALQFDPGEIICREGEYAYTGFYVLEGTCIGGHPPISRPGKSPPRTMEKSVPASRSASDRERSPGTKTADTPVCQADRAHRSAKGHLLRNTVGWN